MYYRTVYPPKRYLFYPLYRLLRHRWRFGMCVSYMTIHVVSALLHGLVIAAFGHPVGGAVWAAVFLVLGGIGTAMVYFRKERRRRQ